MEFKYIGRGLSKFYQRGKWIFKDIDLDFEKGRSYAITGRNGSGKSTLLKILAGQLSLSKGKIDIEYNNSNFQIEKIRHISSYIAPYYNLYEEFTPLELIDLFHKIRNSSDIKSKSVDLLHYFGLFPKRKFQIRTFSSGMKQRMKYVLSFSTDPDVIFLDEPSTNLDLEGIESVENKIKDYLAEKKCIVIATNDEREKSWCTEIIQIKN
jgi:ABC-type multidrug transport system ATPase subunit